MNANIISPFISEIKHIDQQLIPIYTNIIFNNFIHLTKFNYVKHSIKDITKLLSSPSFFGYTISFKTCANTKIIGYLFGEFITTPDGRYVYYLSYIYISPNYQHMKLGSILLKKLISHCKLMGLSFIVLTCDFDDPKILHFYKNFGFVPDPSLRKNKKHDVMCLYL